MERATEGRRCRGCDSALPEEPPRAGRKRHWCSDHCRKRTWERENKTVCHRCWATIWRGDRCRGCFDAERALGHEELLARVERMWNEGLSMKEMARALGRRAVNPEIDELRKRGRIGYRYKAYEMKAAA